MQHQERNEKFDTNRDLQKWETEKNHWQINGFSS